MQQQFLDWAVQVAGFFFFAAVTDGAASLKTYRKGTTAKMTLPSLAVT